MGWSIGSWLLQTTVRYIRSAMHSGVSEYLRYRTYPVAEVH